MHGTPAEAPPTFDVAILGSGLAGATLAMVLARHGARVLLLESGSHPRFAIGESTVPEMGAVARALALRFDVPELAALSSYQELRLRVSANSGVKRNFSFVNHRDGREPRPADAVQFPTLTFPLGPDTHLYRPDIDAWLTAVAVRYGATYRERCAAESVALDADGVTLTLPRGERVRARFLVDGSGHRSVLADALGLRAAPTLRTDSRSLFTHAIGVERVGAPAAARGLPSPLDQGTLHHTFPGGWFWVIPFDNHGHAVNPVCSIGLTLDRGVHPDNATGAEDEFFAFVDRFPLVRRQLGAARAVRGWVKTGRIQYQSTSSAGDRWALLAHTAGFLDPLFSTGMTQTLHSVRRIATALLPALRDGRFEAARFAHIGAQQASELAQADLLVHGAYVAFSSPEHFNAWYRVWAMANFHGSTGYVRLHLKALATGDLGLLDAMDEPPYCQGMAAAQPRVRALVEEAYALGIEPVVAGRIAPGEAAARLYALLGRQDWIPPPFRIARPSHRFVSTFTPIPLMRFVLWGKRRAPPDMRRAYYDIGAVYFSELTRAMAREAWLALSGFWRAFRAGHVSRGRL